MEIGFCKSLRGYNRINDCSGVVSSIANRLEKHCLEAQSKPKKVATQFPTPWRVELVF